MPLLKEVRRLFVFLQRLFAGGGYSGGETWAAARHAGKVELEIVKRSDMAKGFVVLPKRWIVERTFGGSAAVVASPKTSRISRARRSPSSSWAWSG